MSHRTALISAVNKSNAKSPKRELAIYVGMREFIGQFRLLWCSKTHQLFYFTGLGRLFTDFGWPGKFAIVAMLFFSSLRKNNYFLVENQQDMDLFRKLSIKRVMLIDGSGFQSNPYGNTNQLTVKSRNRLKKICYISRFGKSKHSDKILLLLNNLPKDVEILIGGYDITGHRYAKSFQEISKRFNNITHYGDLTQPRVLELFSEADVVLYPTLREGCPLTILEALSVGTLVITTKVPGCIDICKEFNLPTLAGESFANFHSIKKVFDDFFRGEESVDLPNSTRFSIKTIETRFVQIFDEIIPPD